MEPGCSRAGFMECVITGFVPTTLFSAESFIAFLHGLSFVGLCAERSNERGRGRGMDRCRKEKRRWQSTGKREEKVTENGHQVAKEIR